MNDITKAEMDAVLTIVKSPEQNYNANNLAKIIGVTPMGALKILKRLEKESILKSKAIGKAVIYSINTKNDYAFRYVSLILLRESLYANKQIRRWIEEFKRIKNADLIIIFGSILNKTNPQDVDVLLVTDKKRFSKLQKEIKELSELNLKKIHPLYQTFEDLINNIKKMDKPLLSAIKGILVFGEDIFMGVYNESRKE